MATSLSRTAVVMGVGNRRSLAWHVAKSLLERKYFVVITYQNERFESSVKGLVKSFNEEQMKTSESRILRENLVCMPCDVSCDESIDELFQTRLPSIMDEGARINAVVHSIAYAPSLKGGSLHTTDRESFRRAHDVSSYSLLHVARAALPLMPTDSGNGNGNSITALSYIGSSRVMPGYNVMGPAKASLESCVRGLAAELGPSRGVRVNAVSAGPVSTLAARGIDGFSDMKLRQEQTSPLRRNVTGEEIGDVVAYLASGDYGASAITGQVIYADAGFSIH